MRACGCGVEFATSAASWGLSRVRVPRRTQALPRVGGRILPPPPGARSLWDGGSVTRLGRLARLVDTQHASGPRSPQGRGRTASALNGAPLPHPLDSPPYRPRRVPQSLTATLPRPTLGTRGGRAPVVKAQARHPRRAGLAVTAGLSPSGPSRHVRDSRPGRVPARAGSAASVAVDARNSHTSAARRQLRHGLDARACPGPPGATPKSARHRTRGGRLTAYLKCAINSQRGSRDRAGGEPATVHPPSNRPRGPTRRGTATVPGAKANSPATV
jgi:hypothetical protein